jgi:CheY-like chemotaxis protein
VRRPPDNLHKLRVLVVEDEYVIALDLASALLELGAEVIGPVPSVEQALSVIREHADALDAAVLDINLGSETAYPVAEVLREQRVPFVFATGYDGWSIPDAYGDVPRCYKPVDAADVIRFLERRTAPQDGSQVQ